MGVADAVPPHIPRLGRRAVTLPRREIDAVQRLPPPLALL